MTRASRTKSRNFDEDTSHMRLDHLIQELFLISPPEKADRSQTESQTAGRVNE